MTSRENIKQLLRKAWELRGDGNYKASRQYLERALELCQPEDLNLLGRIYHIYMQHEYDHDNLLNALEYNKKSISYYTEAENHDKMAHAIRHRANLQYEMDQLEAAEANFIKALNIYRENNTTQTGDLANALRGYGMLLEKKTHFEKALKVWEEIRDLYQTEHYREGMVEAIEKIKQLKLKLDS